MVEEFLAFVVIVGVVHRGGERRSAHRLRAQTAAANRELRTLGMTTGTVHGRWSRVLIILCCNDGGRSFHLAGLQIVFLLRSSGRPTIANNAHHQDEK